MTRLEIDIPFKSEWGWTVDVEFLSSLQERIENEHGETVGLEEIEMVVLELISTAGKDHGDHK